MRQPRTWLYIVLPLLYLAVIVGLVAFQFSRHTDSFSQSLGDLTLTGRNSSGGQPAELTVRGRDLVFLFDANHSLQVETKDGRTARLRPETWAWKDGNILVTFQQGVQLRFDKSDNALLIAPVANQALSALSALHIPFAPDNGVHMNRGDRTTFVELTRDKSRLLASVDGVRDRIEMDNTFVLTPGKDGFRPARIDPLPAGADSALTWMGLEGASTPTAAQAALDQWWTKAYASWATVTTFSSALIDAWGREALDRNDYDAASGKMFNLLARDRRAWDYDAAPFLGNIVDITANHRHDVEAASSRSQPDWAASPHLWLDARYYGPAGSADRVKGLLLAGKLPDTGAALVGILQNLIDLQRAQPADATAARILEANKALVALVVRREGQLYVQNKDGLFDLRTGLVLGRLWMNWSQTLGAEAYGTAGASLVTSALARQDASGKLPEVLVTQDGLVVRQEGTLTADELYSLVKPAPRRETDVTAWGPFGFVATPTKLVAQSVSDAQAKFSFRFPVGSAEHVVISGVPAFDHITMHGIRWRTDPQFQAYTDGWAYSASTKTLFVKIKHREEVEDLIVHFQPEQ